MPISHPFSTLTRVALYSAALCVSSATMAQDDTRQPLDDTALECTVELDVLHDEIAVLHDELSAGHVHTERLVIPLPAGSIGEDDSDPRVVVIADSSANPDDTFQCLQSCDGCDACLTYGVQGRLVNGTNPGGSTYNGTGSCDCTGGGSAAYTGCANAGTAIWTGGTYAGSGSAVGAGCADAACAAAGLGSCNLATIVQGTDHPTTIAHQTRQ